MGDRKTYLTHQITKYSQLLFDKGFVANHDGNISVKFEETLLATPTAVSKGDIVPEIIITLDMDGKKLEGIGNPFSEIKLHLSAYQADDRIKAVVHAHPPFATARGLTHQNLRPALPEAIVSIGNDIPVVPFAMPGAPENDHIIKNALTQSFVFMLPGNGVLAVGENIEQAYLRLELVEHLAKIDFYAHQMGSPMTLSQENITPLLEKRAKAGLAPQQNINNTIDAINPSSKTDDSIDVIKKLIAEEIKNALR